MEVALIIPLRVTSSPHSFNVQDLLTCNGDFLVQESPSRDQEDSSAQARRNRNWDQAAQAHQEVLLDVCGNRHEVRHNNQVNGTRGSRRRHGTCIRGEIVNSSSKRTACGTPCYCTVLWFVYTCRWCGMCTAYVNYGSYYDSCESSRIRI